MKPLEHANRECLEEPPVGNCQVRRSNGQNHSLGKQRRVKELASICDCATEAHPLGSLTRNIWCPEGIVGALISQNKHVPKKMKDTLVTPEIIVRLFEGLLDLVKKM